MTNQPTQPDPRELVRRVRELKASRSAIPSCRAQFRLYSAISIKLGSLAIPLADALEAALRENAVLERALENAVCDHNGWCDPEYATSLSRHKTRARAEIEQEKGGGQDGAPTD